jgi:nondiscriminating glutamyl-tRNA synthetase
MNAVPVVTRFAPSPTGELHLGNVRTALFNRLLARRSGGRYVLRIEDTDAARTTEAHVEGLVADLHWLGLDWDEGIGVDGAYGPYRQRDRGMVYGPLLDRLLQQDRAYPCYCTSAELELSRRAQLAAGRPPRYAGTCAQLDATARAAREATGARAALRFRIPPCRMLQFDDLVHGPQHVDTALIGDFVIRREDGTPAFFFANAVDDSLMQVTHVLRGEDHLSQHAAAAVGAGSAGTCAPPQLRALAAADRRRRRAAVQAQRRNSRCGNCAKRAIARRRSATSCMYVCGITVYDYCHVGHAR